MRRAQDPLSVFFTFRQEIGGPALLFTVFWEMVVGYLVQRVAEECTPISMLKTLYIFEMRR